MKKVKPNLILVIWKTTLLSGMLVLSSVSFANGTLYNQFSYEGHPWALDFIDRNSDKESKFIARFKYTAPETGKEAHFVFYGNPTDSRGYRSILWLSSADPRDMVSTYSRPFESHEMTGLYSIFPVLTQAYQKLGLYAQIADAENNSHLFVTAENKNNFFKIKNTKSIIFKNDKNSHKFEGLESASPKYKGQVSSQEIEPANLAVGTMVIGTEDEPGMLHAHLIGRGNPEHAFAGNLPLGGPKPGEIFNMRGDETEKDLGNRKKTPWWGMRDSPEVKKEKHKPIEPILQALTIHCSDALKQNPVPGLTIVSLREVLDSQL